MKSRSVLLLAGMTGLLGACAPKSVSKRLSGPVNDSLPAALEEGACEALGRDSVWRMPPETIDTVMGDWHVWLRRQPNDYIIGRGSDYQVADNSLWLTLECRGKTVWKQRELRTKDVVGEMGTYQLVYGQPFYATPSTLYLNIVDCMPESDDLWNMLYCITPGRKPDLYAMDYEMGFEAEEFINRLSEFFHLYFHQKLTMHPTTAQMRELFDRYCDNPLRSRIEGDDAYADDQAILQGEQIDFHSALCTLSIACDSLEAGATVKFVPLKHGRDTIAWRVFGTADGQKLTRIEPDRR